MPDPDRHLSKTHCTIAVDQGQYILTDLSTNGIYVNGASQPTMRNTRVALADGDEFRLGDYLVTVAEVDEASVEAMDSQWELANPFDDGHAVPGASPDDGGPLDVDPLADPFGRPSNVSFQHPVPTTAQPRRVQDPFDDADVRARRPANPEDDLFRGATPSFQWRGPTQPDHADAPAHAFAPPHVVAPSSPGSIDFDALLGDEPPAAAGVPRPAASAAPPHRAQTDPFAAFDDLLPGEPEGLAAGRAPAAAPRPEGPDARRPPMAGSPQAVSVAHEPRPQPEPQSPPRPAPRRTAPGAVPSDPVEAEALLTAFLDGAGVTHMRIDTSDPAATLRMAGQVFRAMTEGLREVLMSRAAIKSEMKIEQTTIRPRDNNPLKFSITADDAIAALLGEKPGYLPPLSAATEALSDIKSHEIAVMAGVQTALLALLKRFDPDALEARLTQSILGAVLPAARKARYWEAFRQTFDDIKRESEDDFQTVFGQAFTRAYIAQTRKK